eukprot:CAMPEP_0202007918 /NCGR_PEP_ID=MMETSP0905-20130828/12273_1 /ASSEMBLY_ACC=CAM_ASM_000554 /TAXON_ID=420261 /ORGANISM="Thalassiosira antarctica, Strain CCMP982" /LENGTH=81 /DNA_ID=CAMNT_0048565959 /DNA_START=215 /DNA_END=459 /DNA_ORIENTATION=+
MAVFLRSTLDMSPNSITINIPSDDPTNVAPPGDSVALRCRPHDMQYEHNSSPYCGVLLRRLRVRMRAPMPKHIHNVLWERV